MFGLWAISVFPDKGGFYDFVARGYFKAAFTGVV